MRLYHGSTVTVRRPNILRGRRQTDFGQGFYTTTSFEQARKWAELKRKRMGVPRAVVSVYEVPDDILNCGFHVCRFSGATKEWLDFVVGNRNSRAPHAFDLVMGPVANDQLYATIRLYEQGVVTAMAAVEMLRTHTLFDQLSFHTPSAIALLKFVESVENEIRRR